MSERSEHIQVASYALGLLDAAEMSRFEDHLADCDDCAEQLEQMLPAVDMLADVEPGDLFGVTGLSAFNSSAGADPYPPIVEAAPAVVENPFWVHEEPAAPAASRADRYPDDFGAEGPPTTKLRTQKLRDERSQTGSQPAVQSEGFFGAETRSERTRSERARGGGADRVPPDRMTTDGPLTGESPRYPSASRSGSGAGGSRRPASSRPRSRRPETNGPPGRSRRGLLIASAAAILGVIAGAGVVSAGPWANSKGAVTAVSTASADRLTATDPKSKVHAEVVLEAKTWGTRVSFGVSDIDGPRVCQLVAVKADGQTEVLSSWNVPKQGYSKGTKPPELTLEASTALERKDISALRVQNVSADGSISNLVTVPS